MPTSGAHSRVPQRRRGSGGQLLPQPARFCTVMIVFPANSLHLPTAQKLIVIVPDSLNVCGNHLELQAGASRINDENVHIVTTDASWVQRARSLFHRIAFRYQPICHLSAATAPSLRGVPMGPDTLVRMCGIGNDHEKATWMSRASSCTIFQRCNPEKLFSFHLLLIVMFASAR